MNFMFFIYIPLVHSVSHTFMTTNTRLIGQAVAGTSKISAETTLDELQIDKYDSDTGTLIQDWMKEFSSGHRWKEFTEIRERVQQTRKLNITVLMQLFSHSQGLHMYKRMYGCVWDDETKVSHGFDEYSYDGEDFISLDLKEGRYTARVPQAEPTVLKWNNDKKQLDFLKQYYKHECIDWLKEFLDFSKDTLKKTGVVTSGQSLTEPIQKNLTVDDTKGSGLPLYALYIVCGIIFILVIFISIALYKLPKYWKKQQSCNKDLYYKKYDKSTPSHKSTAPEDTSSEQNLILSSSDAQNHFPEPSASQILTSGRIFTAIPKNQVIL